MNFPDYEKRTDLDLHNISYLCKDGWWRYKDEWGSNKLSGYGDGTFQYLYLRHSHNLIFNYEIK